MCRSLILIGPQQKSSPRFLGEMWRVYFCTGWRKSPSPSPLLAACNARVLFSTDSTSLSLSMYCYIIPISIWGETVLGNLHTVVRVYFSRKGQ